MPLEDIYNSLKPQVGAGEIDLPTLAAQCFNLSAVTNELPFAHNLTLAGLNITPITNGKFSITGTGKWGFFEGIVAAIDFQADGNATAVQLTLQMPASFALYVPQVDWFSAGQVSLVLSTSSDLWTQKSVYPVAGSIGAVIKLKDTPVPVKIQLDGSSWQVTGDFDNIDFPSLADLLAFIGNTADISLPDGLTKLTAFKLYDVTLPFDPRTQTAASVGVTFGSTSGWEIIPGIFKVDQDQLTITVSNPLDSQNRSLAGSIGAQLTIGETQIGISAAYANAGGWDFQGQTDPGQQIDLGKLLKDLGARFGVSLPGSLNSLNAKNVSVQANTATGDVQLTLTLDWNLASQPIEMATVVKLARQAGQYSPDVTGTLTIANSTFVVTYQDSTISGQWPASAGGPPLDFDDLAASFGLTAAFSKRPPWDLTLTAVSFTRDSSTNKLDLDVEGTLTLAGNSVAFSLSNKTGAWLIEGKSAGDQALDFTALVTEQFQAFGLTLPDHLPAFSLKNIDVTYDFGTGDATFKGASAQPTALQLGNQTHNVDTDLDLSVTTDASGKRSFAGYLRGTITIGSAVFEGWYDFGDATILQATWNGGTGALGFQDLAAAHGIENSLQAPGNMSLPLTRASFEYDVSQGRFLLSADSKYGEAFFVASNANKTWDFAFGILIETSQIPGFPNLSEIELKDTMLVLSTVQDDNFIVPTLPGLHEPGMLAAAPPRTFPTIGTQKMPLKPGVSLAALLDLGNGNGNVVLKNLRSAVGQSELLIQTSVANMQQISFMSELDGSLAIGGSGSDKLVLSDVYVQLQESGIALSVLVGGTVLIPFNNVTLQAGGAMAISETSMEAIFQLKAEQDGQPTAIPTPFGLAGVSLDELDIEVGVDFEPPGVDLGIEGKFNIKGQQADANDFTIVLDLEGEIPNPTYLSTHIQSLTIADAITALTGQTISDAPAFMTAIQGQDISMYWAESAGIVLPDGTLSQGGFGFNGILSVGGFSVHAALAVSTAAGVSGDAEMSPINLSSVFSLSGDGKGVTVKQVQTADGNWEALAVPPEPGQKLTTRDYRVIAPGGATIAFNSKKSPFLDVSAKASLFNFINEEVEIEINDDGFSWKQKESIGSAVQIEFDCALSKSGFSCQVEFDLDIKADIGPFKILGIDFGTLHLDIVFAADLSVAIDAQGFSLEVSGSFEFEGEKLTMPTLTIKESFQSFEQLPGLILKQIEDEAETIFKDLFDAANKLLADAEQEAEAIAAGAEKEAKEIAAGAQAAAAGVINTANQAYEAARRGVAEAEAEVKQIDADAAQVATAAESAAKDIASKAAAEATAIEGDVDSVVNDAANTVRGIENAAGQEVSNIENGAKAIWSAAQNEASQIALEAETDVRNIGQWATNVGNAVVNDAEVFATQVGDEVARIGDEIAEKLKEAAEWLEHQAESAWHAVSKY